MKKITLKFFLVCGLIGNVSTIIGQCPSGNIVLETQEDVDNFSINYPNCTDLQTNLIIQQSAITNLNGLSQIESIGLNLFIKDNLLLTTLTGLNNLETVNSIKIERNHALINLQGLNGLTAINGDLLINNNHSLETLDGIESLEHINLGLGIFHNPELISLNGLSGLTEIEGDLYIENQNTLMTLDGLDNLTSIDGTLSIGINFGLVDISGIRNIDATTIDRLQIHNNDELSICHVKSICDYIALDPWATNLIIEGNHGGCNNVLEVEAACLLSTEENQLARTENLPKPNQQYF